MPFMIQSSCPCCKLNLHHCEKCWNKYHNGEEHNDYELPKYYGQTLISERIMKKVCNDLKKDYKPEVKSDRNRKYVEGDYAH